ncbi:hypothetical protein Poly51_54330 [Rubripirellula tenax]|uniref:Uncharacterized protein n=1 Tax=Rubripirellula tenax TaxID=2528015 RepID=A0A5C6EF66_9BACT|nr:hypothetical protein [Rubripirellula tenax]TWU47632.1 hypothetical protein Poly51_54330 [Rubripirellula tenax]
MAKKKTGGPNKSQAIRDYSKDNPTLKPKQIAADLSKKGVAVSAGFVSTILSTSKRKKKVGRPGRPKGSVKSVRAVGRPTKKKRASSAGSGDVSIDALMKVKQLVAEIGSIDEAKSALSALEKLMR